MWATGFQNQEGNNGTKKTARSMGTSTLTKSYGERFTIYRSDYTASSIPRGFAISRNFFNTSAYSGNDSWVQYVFGTDYVTQPARNTGVEIYCDPVSYSITYNLNGGTNASSNPSTYNVLYGVTFANPTRAGYVFMGWTNSSGQTITGINPGANANHTSGADLINKLSTRTIGNQTVTAKWKAVGWQQNDVGWWYLRADGSYPQNQWEKISDKWYHFDSKGYMQTGWKQLGDKWYYFNPGGSMATGWKQLGGKWYYFEANGVMQTGWLKLNNKWYYLKESGQMAASEWCEGYWLNADGSWTYRYKASWTKNGNGWWFGDESGWYARNTSYIIDGKSYTFNNAGYWVP